MKTMEVITDFEILTAMSEVNQLFSRGILRKRNGSYCKLCSYTLKRALVVRCVIYAMIDLLNEGHKTLWKTLVKKKAEANREEYVSRLKYRIKTDKYVESYDELFEKIDSHKIYNADYVRAWDIICESIAGYKVRVQSEEKGYHVHKLHFTKLGLEIKAKVDDGYVF
ncbi:hypothetical protein ACFL96_13405 [Thermoproteota archaeon]